MKYIITTIITLVLFIATPALAGNSVITGKVVGVSDGDTITVLTAEKQQIKVRLYGIDCPESKQTFGTRAKQATSDAVFGKQVELEIMDMDKYGRTVALVKCQGMLLQEVLLKAGMAWIFIKYCKINWLCDNWRHLENEARLERRGLWQDKNPVPPWEWRHR